MASDASKRKLSETNGDNGEAAITSVSKKLKIESSDFCGVLLGCGLTDYEDRNNSDINKSDHETVRYSPFQYKALDGVNITAISTGPVSYFFYAINDKGEVYSCGLNAKGQLGLNNYESKRNPTLIPDFSGEPIVSIATGRQHGLFLTESGIVYACGDNKNGQCGIGNNKEETISKPKRIKYTGPPIVQIACGAEFSLILDEGGAVYSFGLSEYGQLGLGSENKEVVARKIIFHSEYSPVQLTSFIEVDPEEGVIHHGTPKIVKIACGVNHSAAIDENQRIFTWGFGGYGRLGHSDTKNELLPRLMKCWYRITGRADGGITNVYCGGQFTFVNTITPKLTYMFGQQALNKEANMYPKNVEDLSGWDVKQISCSGTGYIALADNEVIASMPSPCVGTLAMGTKTKSSSRPKIIETFSDVHCYQSGLGYMHSLYLIRNETDKDKNAIDKFPSEQFSKSLAKKPDPRGNVANSKKKTAVTKKKGKK